MDGDWLSGPTGAALLKAERTLVGGLLFNLFGFHILQVGTYGAGALLNASRIAHRIILAAGEPAATGHDAICTAGALPVRSRGLDVVLLPHILEREQDPEAVLFEAERTLVGEGHLVIIGVNPWSLWGLNALHDRSGRRLLSRSRVEYWLRRLDLEILLSQCFYYQLPWRVERGAGERDWLERCGRRMWPACGGLYVIVARKRLVTLIPIPEPRRRERRLVSDGFARTT
ncbi:MAG: methyltransferase type 11 [Gammaproteobacteria bacterium]